MKLFIMHGAQGAPLKVIAKIAGHSDVRLTQNVYQHVYRDAKREAASKMDKLLTGVAAEIPLAPSVATKTGPRHRELACK